MTAGRIYFVLFLIAVAYGLGIYSEHVLGIAAEVRVLYDQIATNQKAQVDTNAMVKDANKKTEVLNTAVQPLKETLHAETIKNPTHCVVPAATFRVLDETARAANSAAR